MAGIVGREMKSTIEKFDNGIKILQKVNSKQDEKDISLNSEIIALKERVQIMEEKLALKPRRQECPKSGLPSGVYTLYGLSYPEGLRVYCDTETDGGGWIVFQSRQNGKLLFDRNWNDYVNGFGKLSGEFWLGFQTLNKLLSGGEFELRIDLWDWEGKQAYAKYKDFAVGDFKDNYKLKVSSFSGNAGDSLSHHSGMGFSTKDRDNDGDIDGNCALDLKGGWWFTNCNLSHLNGKYYSGGYYSVGLNDPMDGVSWYYWKSTKLYSMKRTEMKMRIK